MELDELFEQATRDHAAGDDRAAMAAVLKVVGVLVADRRTSDVTGSDEWAYLADAAGAG